jgi:hypothetical protein
MEKAGGPCKSTNEATAITAKTITSLRACKNNCVLIATSNKYNIISKIHMIIINPFLFGTNKR